MDKQTKALFNLVFFLFLTMFGAMCNMMAVTTNHGRMPVYTSIAYSTKTHYSFDDPNEVNSFYLTDIIKLPFTRRFFSLGDVLVLIGCGGAIFQIIVLTFQGIEPNACKYLEGFYPE